MRAATVVSYCDLIADPAAYDRQVIEVTAFVSHGFEDFTLFDPKCSSEKPGVWVEYGGTFASGTIYCCGLGPERRRKERLVVEDVTTDIVEDKALKRFDTLVQREPDSVVHATLRGHFFAVLKTDEPVIGGGYGHFGQFNLFVIEQVVSVDPHDLRDVDYRAYTDSPDADCVSSEHLDHAAAIELQRQADADERPWAFTDPSRVAAERLGVVTLKQVKKRPGRITYRDPRSKRWVVVSRPYLLTFYAAKRERVAWVPLAVFDTTCKPES